MIGTLLRKDARMLVPAMIAAGAIALICYGIVWPSAIINNREGGAFIKSPAFVLAQPAVLSLVLTSILAAVFGGTTQPTERRERWADFLAMLPVTRRDAVISRLLSGAGLFLAAWGVNAIVVWASLSWMYQDPAWQGGTVRLKIQQDLLPLARAAPVVSLAMFGVAWLLGTMLKSPAWAACVAIGLALAGFLVAVTVAGVRNANETPYLATYLWACGGLGLLALGIGVGHALRRVEP